MDVGCDDLAVGGEQHISDIKVRWLAGVVAAGIGHKDGVVAGICGLDGCEGQSAVGGLKNICVVSFKNSYKKLLLLN